jgi:hypothetical protein
MLIVLLFVGFLLGAVLQAIGPERVSYPGSA